MSQFAKRKAKEKAAAKEVEKVNEPEAILAEYVPEEHALTYTAYDTYYDKESRSHKAVSIEYDPISKTAKVLKSGNISRQVGLVQENQKQALKSLIKKIKE